MPEIFAAGNGRTFAPGNTRTSPETKRHYLRGKTMHKRNQFLDADDSEDDAVQDYDSDDDLRKGGRAAKRRKVDDEHSDDQSSSDDGHEAAGDADQDFSGSNAKSEEGVDRHKLSNAAEEDVKPKREPTKLPTLPTLSRPFGKKNLVTTKAAIKKSGVVYLSRIPPHMKPAKLRSLLEPYGTINRTFLSPEDPATHARRVRAGGNKKKSFVDGWVEFVSKHDAKRACELLNARPIGGKKGSYYRDDMWTLLYLRGFKWDDLTAQIAAENAERESRMRAEISKTTRENKEFVRNVEQAKVLDGMRAKEEAKKKRRKVFDEDAGENKGEGEGDETAAGHERRTFKQVPLVRKQRVDEDQPEQVKRVLSKIF